FGTNAEIAVITEEKIFCTSASAGPCFEGTNISCGMTAKYGAISEFKINKGTTEFKTIGEGAVKGICGTGLIDVVSELLRNFIIDENGTFFENDEFEIYNEISVTQEDIREFQSAKSAVRTAMEVLLEKSGYCLEDIDNFYVSGGFSGSLNVQNAKLTGLIPASVENVKLLYNTSLLGAIRNYNEERVLQKCEYVDLIQDTLFQKRFLENMSF
ncbi:MAG: DUF4445 domain-containing protein, partial [Clostridia bacterium]|nr:DUF4445 domain-containing protein [Clostridia bacterium]